MLSLTSERQTLWHRVPAGPKLLALMGITIAAFWMTEPVHGLVFLGVVAIAYATGGKGFFIEGARMLRPVIPFVVILLLWHWLTDEVPKGILIVSRMAALVALANLVTMTTRLQDMLDRVDAALGLFRVPLQTRRRLSLAVALVIRFTPVLLQKGRALTQAWKARSTRRPGWRLILPFALLAIDDAEQVADALRARSGGL